MSLQPFVWPPNQCVVVSRDIQHGWLGMLFFMVWFALLSYIFSLLDLNWAIFSIFIMLGIIVRLAEDCETSKWTFLQFQWQRNCQFEPTDLRCVLGGMEWWHLSRKHDSCASRVLTAFIWPSGKSVKLRVFYKSNITHGQEFAVASLSSIFRESWMFFWWCLLFTLLRIGWMFYSDLKG